MGIKIAFIGAGSISFTRPLIRDLLAVPGLDDLEFALTDTSKRNLDMVHRLIMRDVEASGTNATVQSTFSRRRAVKDARYVFYLVRVGHLEALKLDIDIPLQYGIHQCVGDTLGPGGIMYAQRQIPVLLGTCKDIREVAHPDCLLLNYANPLAMLTWCANEYGRVPTVGLCPGVINSSITIAELLDIPMDELDIVAAGINHQVWFLSVKHRGREMTPYLLDAFASHPVYSKTERIRIDMLKRFGYFTTESNGHVSEYVPWYRKRPAEICQWIALDSWEGGETGGYLRACSERRLWFQQDYENLLEAPCPPPTPEERSREYGSYVIEAMETDCPYRGYINVVNEGRIPNLPEDCVIEGPASVDRHGVNVPQIGPLPLACAATCSASIHVQRMAIVAAVQGDLLLLKQAMLHDPLTAAVCNPPEVWRLTDELLLSHARWLPQYANVISEVRRRFAASTPPGNAASHGVARREGPTTERAPQAPLETGNMVPSMNRTNPLRK